MFAAPRVAANRPTSVGNYRDGLRRIARLLNDVDAAGSCADGKGVARQRFLWSMIESTADAFAADLAVLSARFSFSDFPDFLVIPCRGDLSDMSALHSGPWAVPMARPYSLDRAAGVSADSW